MYKHLATLKIALMIYLSGCFISLVVFPILIKNFDWKVKSETVTYSKRLLQLKEQYMINVLFSWIAVIIQAMFYRDYLIKKKKEKQVKEEAADEETDNNEV